MYWLAAFFQIVFIGSLLAMCHQLIVTGLLELVLAAPEPLLVLLSLPPQAATTNAATASSAATARLVFLIARPSSWLEWMPVAAPDPSASAVGS
jgi:spore maturation protein SpmB